MKWTYDKVLAFYQRVRRNAKCTKCGRHGYVVVGPHPSGVGGQPVRVSGANLPALKEWLRATGWRCPSCKSVSADADGGSQKSKKARVRALRKSLKSYCPTDWKGRPDKSCKTFRDRLVRFEETLKRLEEQAVKRFPDSKSEQDEWVWVQCWKINTAGAWVDPEVYRSQIEELEQLTKELNG